MKTIFTVLLSLILLTGYAQSFFDLEEFAIEQDSFLNGSDLSGGFMSDIIFFPNDYSEEWGSWTGWSLSNVTDNTTAGFTNQYSCIAGSGNANSDNYATSFVSGSSAIEVLLGIPNGEFINGFHINNATYTYLSMLDGDAFAKKFGGETGDDPDFLRLTIKGFSNGEMNADSVDFYLADYRFTDNSMDYLINEWTFVDISTIGVADSIVFNLNSSDTGQFGMNTPAYFCLDDIQTDAYSSNNDLEFESNLRIFPNPTSTVVNIDSELSVSEIKIYTFDGRLLVQRKEDRIKSIDLSSLTLGSYILQLNQNEHKTYRRLVKQ